MTSKYPTVKAIMLIMLLCLTVLYMVFMLYPNKIGSGTRVYDRMISLYYDCAFTGDNIIYYGLSEYPTIIVSRCNHCFSENKKHLKRYTVTFIPIIGNNNMCIRKASLLIKVSLVNLVLLLLPLYSLLYLYKCLRGIRNSSFKNMTILSIIMVMANIVLYNNMNIHNRIETTFVDVSDRNNYFHIHNGKIYFVNQDVYGHALIINSGDIYRTIKSNKLQSIELHCYYFDKISIVKAREIQNIVGKYNIEIISDGCGITTMDKLINVLYTKIPFEITLGE